jgi:hypothetical protein
MEPFRPRPDWVRRLNDFGPATGDPRHVVPLDADALLALARRSTGLEEIGDAHWLETYARCVDSIDASSGANLLGRLLGRAEILRVLQTKLRLHAAWAADPSMLEEPIERPLFVLGAPRTGTTILLELLALDPSLRAPISWEAQHPLPFPGAESPETRRRLAEAEHELWIDIQPELATLHELRADLPCECVHFLAMEFGGPYWLMQYPGAGFGEWLATQSEILPRTYAFHRRFLQTLQHGQPRRRWLLKSPAHLMTAEALFAEYPDAIVVHTHRDPHRFVGSAASTTAMLHWIRNDTIEPKLYGQLALGSFSYMLGNLIEQRAKGTLPDDQFVDSHYLDLIESPVDAIRRIYERAGLDWPEGHEARILGYLADKPKGKFGRHAYTLEEYGLDAATVDAAYASYVEHYAIRSEH